MILTVIIIATIALVLLYRRATSHYRFWEKHGVKCPVAPTLRSAFEAAFKPSKVWNNFAPDEPYIGLITPRSLAVSIRDPELLRLVLSKDFAYFHDRGMPFNEKKDPLTGHLFNLEGRRWKVLRAKLTPTFTSGKLRGMFPHMKQVSDQLISILSPHVDKTESVDLSDFLSRYTTDVILSCAFGLQGNCLRDPDDIYLRMVKLSFTNTRARRFFFGILRLFPSLDAWLPQLEHRKITADFFLNSFKSTVRTREESGFKRNDFLDLLLEIKKTGRILDAHVDDDALDTSVEFTDTLMVAQAFVFFVAGSETSSGTSSFAIVELANNTDIQDKLRAEVDRVLQKHGALTYDAIMEMSYLDQVVSETLRKYPPADSLMRIVTKPYPLPDGKATLPVGTRISIPVSRLHYDPRYYPDPERFNPERFSPEEKQARHKYVYLPFGEGPRICIGNRFGLMQVKIALASIISQFEISPKPGTPYPPRLSPKSVVTSLEEGGARVLLKSRPTKPKL